MQETITFGERAADALARFAGSWKFIIGQTVFIWLWIMYQTFSGHPFDVYPWILLNLCMSTQAMYTGPIVLLAQNRQSIKDRIRDDNEAAEVERSLQIDNNLLEILNQQADLIRHQSDQISELRNLIILNRGTLSRQPNNISM